MLDRIAIFFFLLCLGFLQLTAHGNGLNSQAVLVNQAMLCGAIVGVPWLFLKAIFHRPKPRLRDPTVYWNLDGSPARPLAVRRTDRRDRGPLGRWVDRHWSYIEPDRS